MAEEEHLLINVSTSKDQYDLVAFTITFTVTKSFLKIINNLKCSKIYDKEVSYKTLAANGDEVYIKGKRPIIKGIVRRSIVCSLSEFFFTKEVMQKKAFSVNSPSAGDVEKLISGVKDDYKLIIKINELLTGFKVGIVYEEAVQ